MASGTSLTGLGTRRKSRRLPIIPIFSWACLLIAVLLFAFELIRFSQQIDRLSADVSVGGVSVGGLSAAEAVARWEQAYAQPITLWYENSPILLDPASVGFRTNRESMLAAARAASEQEQTFWERFFNYLTGNGSSSMILQRAMIARREKRVSMSRPSPSVPVLRATYSTENRLSVFWIPRCAARPTGK